MQPSSCCWEWGTTPAGTGRTTCCSSHAWERNGVLWDLGLPNVLTHKRLARRRGEHEAEKPVELFWDLARALTRAGDVVADFFVGRGRWIQRLLDEGRHVIAVDRNPDWVRAIAGDFTQGRLA